MWHSFASRFGRGVRSACTLAKDVCALVAHIDVAQKTIFRGMERRARRRPAHASRRRPREGIARGKSTQNRSVIPGCYLCNIDNPRFKIPRGTRGPRGGIISQRDHAPDPVSLSPSHIGTQPKPQRRAPWTRAAYPEPDRSAHLRTAATITRLRTGRRKACPSQKKLQLGMPHRLQYPARLPASMQ